MAEKKEEKKTDGLLDIIKTFLPFIPAISVFTALIYFFGRIYIEEYYEALGISPHVLKFNTEDYMFFSYDIVIMCLVFSILFFYCWRGILFERIDFERRDKEFVPVEDENNQTEQEKKKKPNVLSLVVTRTPVIFLLFVLAWLLGMIYYLWFHFSPGSYITGLSGLATGLVFGVGLIVFVAVLRAFSRSIARGSFRLQWVIGVLLAFCIMPWITTDLASAKARCDEYGFQDVKVITKDTLHCEMQSATSNLTDCLDGKLIIINNDMAYVMKLIKTAPDTDCKTISINIAGSREYLAVSKIRETVEDYAYCQLVYAIPMESVRDIIYFSQK